MIVTAIPGKYDGCWYVRCVLPGVQLGWNLPKLKKFEVTSWEKNMKEAFEMAMKSDIVVFQRPSDDLRLKAMKLLQERGKKVVFDNDDTYKPNAGIPMARFSKKGQQIVQGMNKNLNKAVEIADLVVTSTEFLANEYREINPNVVVLPNFVSPMEAEEKIPNDTGKKRLGFIGSVLSNEDTMHIDDQLMALSKEYQFVGMGLYGANGDYVKEREPDIRRWNTMGMEWHNCVDMMQYFHKLNTLKLDAIVIPRQDNYFNRCKSNIKFLEASLMKIPVIAQGFTDFQSPYQVNENDRHNMRIVVDNSLWYDTVKEVLEDKDLGQKAHDYVLEEYNIETKAHLWEDAFNKLL